MTAEIVPEDVLHEVNALTAELVGEDALGMVLRVHLRIENVLERILQALLPSPGCLLRDDRSLRYEMKVRLVLALGALTDIEAPLRAFGKLRNDFAHQPDKRLDAQSASKLYDSLSAAERHKVLRSFERMKRDKQMPRGVDRFTDLPPEDQFKVITLSVWTSVRTALEQAKRLGPLRPAGGDVTA